MKTFNNLEEIDFLQKQCAVIIGIAIYIAVSIEITRWQLSTLKEQITTICQQTWTSPSSSSPENSDCYSPKDVLSPFPPKKKEI